MPRYFFHLHDGQDLPDHAGQDFPDLRAAQAHAAEVVYLQLKEEARSGLMTQEWTLDVQNDRRQSLFTLRFKATEPNDYRMLRGSGHENAMRHHMSNKAVLRSSHLADESMQWGMTESVD